MITNQRLAELDAASNLGEFLLATGSRAPDAIWLIAMACGETAWNVDADPEGDGEPSVAYIRASELRALIDVQATTIAGLREALGRLADVTDDPFTFNGCKMQCARTARRDARAALTGAA